MSTNSSFLSNIFMAAYGETQSFMNGGAAGGLWRRQQWLDHLLLITSYLVNIETDHHWTCLKMRARDKRLSTENVRCWCFILSEKSQKNQGGVASTPHPYSLYVRELKCYFFEKGKYDKGHACYSQNIAGIDVQPVTPRSFSLRII